MSMRALLLATRDHLRAELNLSDTQTDIMPDGRPPPWAGECFYSVHQSEWSSKSDLSLEEVYGTTLTITLRASGEVPWDRSGIALLCRARTGLYARAEQARARIHMNETLRIVANGLIAQDALETEANQGQGANGFNWPLVFQSAGAPEPKGADWFHAQAKRTRAECGWAIALRFTCGRIQVIEEMT